MLLAIASTFLPFVGDTFPDETTLLFDPTKVLFGGEDIIVREGYIYNYQFSMNLPIIIILFFCLIGAMAAFTGRNSPHNIGIAMVISLGVSAAFFFTRLLVSAINESLVLSSLSFGPGYYLSILCAVSAFLINLVEFILSNLYWKKKIGK